MRQIMRMQQGAIWLSAAVLAAGVSIALCQEVGGDEPEVEAESGFVVPWRYPPTLGGKLLWTDEYFFRQWRIQRHTSSGRFRLLDGNDLQHAAGGYVECRAALEKIRRRENLAPVTGKVVIVLHGLFRSRSSMNKLCEHLGRRGAYTVLNMSYASTQQDVAAHAVALGKIVRQLDDVEEVSFVGHSMGNIVVRKYLHDRARGGEKTANKPKIGRFVMLAPPNHGSVLAMALSESRLFTALTGESGQQLGRRWEELKTGLGRPSCEFGIIAGGRGNDHGLNPLIPGDDDGTVAVASTRLAGAADFVLVPSMHTFIMNDSAVLDYTLRFLQKGYFVAPDRRQPIKQDEQQDANDER